MRCHVSDHGTPPDEATPDGTIPYCFNFLTQRPAAPAPPQAYTAPPLYAAPVYTAPQVYVVPAPVYVTPLVPRYYAAPVVSQPIYAYAPGYWGGYGHGWRGYGHRYVGWR
jgi:hypothetical protein